MGFEAAAMSILKGAKPRLRQGPGRLIVSAEAQKVPSAKKTYFFPVRADVSAGEGLPALSEIKLIDYDRIRAAQEKSASSTAG